MNRLTKPDGIEVPILDEDAALYAGTITSGVATDFVQFSKVFKNLVTFEAVCANPYSAAIPDDVSAMWATVTHLMERVDEHTLEPVMEYISRYELQMRVLGMRSALIKNPDWVKHKAMRKPMVELAKYLWTDDN